MDIYVQSTSTECNQYEPAQEEPVTVIISPLRIEGVEGHLKVISGCNLFGGCQNSRCYFSAAARSASKKNSKK